MILIATGADASANNIGQVEVPIIWDTDAQAYINHIPTALAGFDYTQKRALNNFFKGVKSAGVWSKISQLVLPILGQSEGGVNLKAPASNLTLPVSGASYNDKGVLLTTVWSPGWSISGTDSHLGFYNTEDAGTGADFRVGISAASSWWIARSINGVNAGAFFANGIGLGSTAIYIPGKRQGIGPVIASNKTSLPLSNVVIEGSYTEIAQAFTPGIPSIRVGFSATTANPLGVHIGLVTHGSFLNQTESIAYSNLQTALMTALLA